MQLLWYLQTRQSASAEAPGGQEHHDKAGTNISRFSGPSSVGQSIASVSVILHSNAHMNISYMIVTNNLH